jgi:hypothetical protein
VKTGKTLRAGYSNRALSAALYLGRNYFDKTLRELGELAGGMQYPAMTMAIRRFANRLETGATLARKVKRLQPMLLVRRDPIPSRPDPPQTGTTHDQKGQQADQIFSFGS